MSNIVTGLDIGSAQIKCVVALEKKDGTLSIISAFKQPSSGIRRGVLVDIEEASRVLAELISDLAKISKRCAENLFVNINSEHVKARHSRGIVAVQRGDKEIQQDDIDRVIQSAAAIKISPNHLVLHNIIKEFFVDDVGDIQNPLGVTGNRLEASTLIVEAFAPHVNMLTKCLQGIGAGVGGLIFNPLTASHAVLSKKQKNLGVLLVDFGFGTTSLAVFEENKVLHAKSFPIGSGHITSDIAIGLKAPFDVAEAIKLKQGYALARDVSRREVVKLSDIDSENHNEVSKRFVAEIIESRLAELLDLINNELKSLGRAVQLPGGAVITGGGVKLGGITDLVRQELKLPVQIGLPDLTGFEVLNPAHEELIDDPEFSAAVGLVLWGRSEARKPAGFLDAAKNVFKNLIP